MGGSRPPTWARRLVSALVKGPHREFVLGDLEEMYARRRARGDGARGTLLYLAWGIRSAGWRGAGLRAGLAGDVRSALRQVRRHPRVYVGGALLLAVGLGAATAAWGILHGLFGQGLPVAEPDRLVTLLRVDAVRGEVETGFSLDDLELVRSVAGVDEAGLWGWSTVTLADPGHAPERIEAFRVTPSMVDLREITPLHGRALLPDDARAGASPVVVLAHRFWARRFGADPEVVGRVVRIDGRASVVAGVLPPEGRMASEDVWLPLGPGADRRARAHWLLVRRAPGVGAGALASALRAAGEALAPDAGEARVRHELRALPFGEAFRVASDGPYTRVVFWSGLLLFLMALANVANLFLVRAGVRGRELAVRRALGAGRLRILRQLAVEAAVPAALGSVGAAALAAAALDGYRALRELYAGGSTVVWNVFRLQGSHLALLAAGAVLSTVVVSLIAGMQQLVREDGAAIRGGRGTTGRFPLGRALMVGEVALGGALLLLGSMMARSAWNLRTVDWGFARASVMTGRVTLDTLSYTTREARLRFWHELEAELGALAGHEAATLATQLPMIRYGGAWEAHRAVEVDGTPSLAPDAMPRHYVDAVTPAFFRTFEARLLAGRAPSAADVDGSEPVALVNAPFARRYFPDGDVLGRRVRVWTRGEPGPWRTVVGLAPHLWMDSDENRAPEGLYVPLAQAAPPEASFAIRVRGDPTALAPTLRAIVHRLDPEAPVNELRSMPELIRWRTRAYQVFGFPFIGVGVAALLLAVAGLYAVVSYVASLRTAEFAVRTAVGASRASLVARAVRAEAVPVSLGVAVGAVGGLALTRGFARWMFEVEPWSPAMTAASFAFLLLVAVAAVLVPALRASRVDLRSALAPD